MRQPASVHGVLLRLGAALGAAAVLAAMPRPGQAAACVADTLASYLALGAGGCQLGGGLSVSGFSVEPFPSATVNLDPLAVQVIPLADGLTLGSQPLAAGPGELLGLRLLLHVAGGTLTGGEIALDPAAAATADGVITGLFDDGLGDNAIAVVTEQLSIPSSSFDSPLSSFFDVFVEIGLDGGLAGSAAIRTQLATLRVRSDAGALPEPAVPVLLAAALAGLALTSRHVRRGR